MSLDVLIVAYRCRDALASCLRSLQGSAADLNVIVVDNDSDDGTVEMVRDEFPAVTLVALDHNVGFGAGVNVAAAEGSAEQLLVLNPDASIDRDDLARLRGALAGDPGLGAVGPLIRGDAGELELSRGRTMGPGNDAWFKLVEKARSLPPVAALLERSYRRSAETRSLTAACLLLRRAAFESIGGFDERFFLYGEDVDLCRRLIAAGWRLRYVATASARHSRGVSAAVHAEATEVAYRRSQLAFYRKHHPAWLAHVLGVYLRTRYGWRGLVRAGEAGARARRVRDAIRAETGGRE